MIEILEYPDLVSFTANKIKFRVRSDNYIVEPGRKVSFTLEQIYTLYDGQYFEFPYIGKAGSFIVQAVANPQGSKRLTAGVSIEQTFEELKFFPEIIENYNIRLTASRQIVFESKYCLYQPFNVILPAGYILIARSYGEAPQLLTDMQIKVRLFIENEDKVFENQLTTIIHPDNSGIASIDISDIIDSFIFFALPGIHQPDISIVKMLTYKLGFSEYFANMETKIEYSLTRYAQKGTFKGFNIFDNRFLTLSDNMKMFFEASQYFAWFHNIPDVRNVELVYRYYFKDDTNITQSFTYVGVNEITDIYHHLLVFCVYIPRNMLFTKPLDRIEFWLQNRDNNEVISEKKSIEIIDQPVIARQYLGLNTFGVWEMFCATGKIDQKVKIERTTQKKFSADQYHKFQFSGKMNSLQNEITVRTGYLDENEIIVISQILSNDTLYLFDNETFKKLTLTNDSINLVTEENELNPIEFTYVLEN